MAMEAPARGRPPSLALAAVTLPLHSHGVETFTAAMLPKLRPERVRAASEGVREVLELLLPCTVQEPAKEAPLKEMLA